MSWWERGGSKKSKVEKVKKSKFKKVKSQKH